jgi:hypothetical protein
MMIRLTGGTVFNTDPNVSASIPKIIKGDTAEEEGFGWRVI